jgi:anti-sigma regulatory factor (Ser/Thr protein kinase)
MGTSFTASYAATPESISIVRNEMAALARDCGLDAAAVCDVRLAVSEAATNALVHGYRYGPGTIRVEASTSCGELRIAVCDDGDGMRPRTDSPGLGLGLPVIASVANRLEVLDDGPGTRLRMTFDCPRSPVPDAPVA